MTAAVRPAARQVARLLTLGWPAHTRLFLAGEGVGWVIDEELRAVGALAAALGVRLGDVRLLSASRRQCVFHGSHFDLLGGEWRPSPHRLATAYFHGRPGTAGAPEFDACFENLRRHHAEISRIQVSHREMEEIVLGSGIEPTKVRRIPIGIEPRWFSPATPEQRAAARRTLGLPVSAFVVGSFQKDGVGFGQGREPKLVKGPDVLVDTLDQVRAQAPELHVLLSGPARGYVRAGLAARGIPHVHRLVSRASEIGALYHALDAYVVTSRQEGGPKAVLEAMASGVPLVTTPVGQAADLVRHGENGWVAPVDDAAGLAALLADVTSRPGDASRLVAAGLATAAEHTYEAQTPLWSAFLDGFVERGPA